MKNFLKKHIKKILIALGIIGVAIGATLLPTEPVLTQVPIIQTQIGERYVHKFQDKTTGEIFEVETTKIDYDKLALKNAKQPTYSNAKWLQSVGGQPIYSTSTPMLLDNQYFTISSSTVLIKLPNESEKIIDSLELNSSNNSPKLIIIESLGQLEICKLKILEKS